MNYALAAWLCLNLFGPALCQAAELKPETVKAWEAYFQLASASMNARPCNSGQFLWVDEQPERLQRVKKGEIIASPHSGTGQVEVPHGLIHHWTAAAFIPNATQRNILDVVNDYKRYNVYYKPPVVKSEQISGNADDGKFAMRMVRKTLLMTAAIDIETETRLFRQSETQWYTVTWSDSIKEIENYGKSNQRILDPGQGNGFIWRAGSINRFAERDGGIYMEVEAMVLSREIPPSAGWFIKPIASRLARSAVVTALEQTRAAVRFNMLDGKRGMVSGFR